MVVVIVAGCIASLGRGGFVRVFIIIVVVVGIAILDLFVIRRLIVSSRG